MGDIRDRMFFTDLPATNAKPNDISLISRFSSHNKFIQLFRMARKSAYKAEIAAASPRKSAENEKRAVVAPPVKGAAEDDEPEPDGEAAPDAVPVGGLVVEAVG